MSRMSISSNNEVHEAKGHEYEVVAEIDGDLSLRCNECRNSQLVMDGDDVDDILDLMAPETCKRVVVRDATEHRNGIAVTTAEDSGAVIEKFDEDGESQTRLKVSRDERSELAHCIENLEDEYDVR